MTEPAQLFQDTQYRRLVAALLEHRLPGARAWVYGSRSHGCGLRPASDLDLAVDAGRTLDLATLAELREDFSESSLPFRVDLVDLRVMAPAFLRGIRGDLSPLIEEPQ